MPTVTMPREDVQEALDVLLEESDIYTHRPESFVAIIYKLRAALAQPEQEPESLLRKPVKHISELGPCHCPPGRCSAPVIMGVQTMCLRNVPGPDTDLRGVRSDTLNPAPAKELSDEERATHTINTDHTVAVSTEYYWQPMRTCPLGVKLLLLGMGGVATVGQYNGKELFWQGWFPLPKTRKDLK